MPGFSSDNNVAILISTEADNSGIDEAERGLSKLDESTTKSSGSTTNWAGEITKAVGIATGLGAVLGTVAKSALDQASSYQQSRVSFETMLGSADKAKTLLNQVSDFAAKTPFQLPDVVEGSKNLLAFGVDMNSIIPTFTTLGNIAAGVGTDKLPGLITVFGQVKSAGRLMTQDLLQFTSAGVPIIDLLAQHFGTTSDKVRGMVEDGKVGFGDLQQSLELLGGPSGKWGDLMAKQSQTFNGTLSNVQDNMGRILRQAVGIGPDGDIRQGSLFDVATKGVTSLMNGLDQLQPKIDAVVGFFEHNKVAVEALVGALGGVFLGVIVAVVVAIGWIPFAIIGVAMAVGALVAIIITNWSTIASFTVNIWNHIFEFFRGIFTSIGNFFKTIADFITGIWILEFNIIKGVFNAIGTAFAAVYNTVIKPVVNLMMEIFHVWWAVVSYIFSVYRGIAIVVFNFVYDNVIKPVVDKMVQAFNWFSGIVAGVWRAISSAAQAAFGWIWDNVISPYVNLWVGIIRWYLGIVADVWNVIRNTAVAAWGSISGFISGVWDKITGAAGTAGNGIKGVFAGVAGGIKNVFGDAVNWIISKLNSIIGAVNNTVGKLPGVGKIPTIPGFANGVRNFSGGLALVGEQGPEYVSLPPGSSVYTNSQSRQMAASGSNTTTIGQVVLNSKEAVQSFFRELNNDSVLAGKGFTTRMGA